MFPIDPALVSDKKAAVLRWRLLFEFGRGSDKLQTGELKETEKGYRIELHLTYTDPIPPGRKPSTSTWTDALHVVREEDRYVVDDVELLGTWPYGNHGLLSKSLHYRHK